MILRRRSQTTTVKKGDVYPQRTLTDVRIAQILAQLVVDLRNDFRHGYGYRPNDVTHAFGAALGYTSDADRSEWLAHVRDLANKTVKTGCRLVGSE